MPRTDVPLKDGRYKAACRERSLLAAAPNGHSQVFPHSLVVVKKGRAHFYIDSVERCWRTKPRNGHVAPILLGYVHEIVAYDGWINESWQVKS